jgi:cytoskeleton protein RodZ
MTIQGKAPLRITVGKPELTSIIFNDQPVDMSAFDIGNIAKFNLPIVE